MILLFFTILSLTYLTLLPILQVRTSSRCNTGSSKSLVVLISYSSDVHLDELDLARNIDSFFKLNVVKYDFAVVNKDTEYYSIWV